MSQLEDPVLEDFDPYARKGLEKTLEAMETLDAITQASVARIPEPIFKEHILPILVNYDGKQSLVNWQRVAGHVLRALEVFDPRNGNVLFTVPPLLRQIRNEITGRGQHSAYEIIQTAEKKRQVVPALGDAYLRKDLVSRFQKEVVDVEAIRQWNQILARYGYPPRIQLNEAKVESTPPPVNGVDIQDYEDL